MCRKALEERELGNAFLTEDMEFFSLFCDLNLASILAIVSEISDLKGTKTARRPSQSILKEFNLEYSLEGLMLKRQCFGHLM